MDAIFSQLSDEFRKFMEPELIRPWTINLLYGHKLFGIAFSQILGWGFILGVLIYLIFPRQRRLQFFLTMMISFWLIFDLRLNYDIYKNYLTAKAELQKGIYFTIEDFYPFLDYINEKIAIAPVNKIYYVGQHWPYENILQYYLLPHKVVGNIREADYLVLYRFPFHIEGDRKIVSEKGVICEQCEWIGMFRPGCNLFKVNKIS